MAPGGARRSTSHGSSVIAWLVCLGLAGGCAEPRRQRPIRIVTTEWPPFVVRDDASMGRVTKIVTTALERIGYAPQVSFLPWDRALARSKDNEGNEGIRGLFPAYLTPEREEDFYASVPIVDEDFFELVIYGNRRKAPDAAAASSLTDLEGCPAVFPRGYEFPATVKRMFRSAEQVDNEVLAFARVIDPDNEAVLVPAEREVGRAILEQHFYGAAHIVVVGQLRWPYPLRFLASKANPENGQLVQKLSGALRDMQDEIQEFQELERRRRSHAARPIVRLSHPYGLPFAVRPMEDADADALRLPRGTRAVVLRWSDALRGPESNDAGEGGLTRVRLLNGPLKGHDFLVQDAYIELL